jgi:beta-glucanase (GH16 family)
LSEVLNPKTEGKPMQSFHVRVATKTATLAALLLALAMAVPSALSAASRKQQGAGKPNSNSGWREDFSSSRLNNKLWVIASGQAPGYISGSHYGDYVPSHVKVVSDSKGSYLQLLLTQEFGTVDGNPDGYLSHGALIYTKAKYGYGTYELRMRMSSSSASPNGSGDAVSGSVSAGFAYVNNSQTEIDFEFSALDPETLYMVNWLNPDPSTGPFDTDRTYDISALTSISTTFHDYKFIWQPGEIDFYVDGVFQTSHNTDVPSAPAYFMINHWGTDSLGWGGDATPGVARFFYVDWVQYTPLP